MVRLALFCIFQYLSEVNEIENWINDKMSLASSTDYGKDENAADKLLAKNKVLETDIQTYQGIVSGVDRECKRLFKTGCQDPQSLKKAQVWEIFIFKYIVYFIDVYFNIYVVLPYCALVKFA